MPLYKTISPAKLGPWPSAVAFWSIGHNLLSNVSDYAIIQSTSGNTHLNTSTGTAMSFRVGGAVQGNCSTTGLGWGNSANNANATIDVLGSAGIGSILTTTASLTLNETNHTVLSNSTVAAISITLPNVGVTMARREYICKKIDATTLAMNIVAPSTASLIDGSTLQIITAQNAGLHLKSSTGGWHIIGRCSTL